MKQLYLAKRYFSFPSRKWDIPSTIVNRTSSLQSYHTEAQGKHYCRIREHIHSIQQDIFKHPAPEPEQPQNPQPSHIPKPFLSARAHPHIPQPICPDHKSTTTASNSHIPRPQHERISSQTPIAH